MGICILSFIGVRFLRRVKTLSGSGQMPESEIRPLLKRLGESITETLSNSPEIHNRIQEIRDAGYEIFLAVETKVGFCSANGESHKTDTGKNETPACLNLTEYDVNFLKSLKIAIN
jgi:hypothetical protein